MENVKNSKRCIKHADANSLPRALYKGLLPIGGVVLQCVVLDNGKRVLPAVSVFKAFGRKRRGNRERDPYILLDDRRIQMPPFIAGSNLIPFIDNELGGWIQTIEYQDGAQVIEGYDANVIPAICRLYISARRAGELTTRQKPFAVQAEILFDSFARVGIIALIDEATGYQHARSRDALKLLLEQYVTEGLQKWVKTFPDLFFENLDRLYNNPSTTASKRPQYYGHFINQYIYNPIESGYVKKELNTLNITDEGKRRAKFHQWLSDFGKSMLTLQIGRIIGNMEICQTISEFKRKNAKLSGLSSIAPSLFDHIEEWN